MGQDEAGRAADRGVASGAADGIEHFRDAAKALVRPGFVTLDEALEQLLEQADDDPDIPLSPAEAEAVVRDVWAERAAELADKRAGDDVRVDAAFQALRGAGYVAEMNLGYTMSDAWDEVGGQVEASPAKGLAFFHGQDAERLAFSPAELYIGFDCVSGEDADMVAVAHRIVSALQAEGLRVEWDGTAGTRIKLIDVDWRRPLPGTEAAAAP